MANLISSPEDFGTGWVQTNSSAGVNTIVALDGTTTGDKLIDDGATGSNVVQFGQVVSGVPTSSSIVVSVFAKADQLDWAYFEIDSYSTPPSNTRAWFDLTNGAVGSNPSAGIDTTGIDDYGDGWYRCWATFTTAADSTGVVRIGVTDADDGLNVDRDNTSSMFVWGAHMDVAPLTNYVAQSGAIISLGSRGFVHALTQPLVRSIVSNLTR
jgi:hypothetical protein